MAEDNSRPYAPRAIPDLTGYRRADAGEVADSAEYAVVHKARVPKNQGAAIVRHIFEHLELCGFLILKAPPAVGGAPLMTGFKAPATMSEQRAADAAAAKAERKKYPSWDDWD